MIYLSSHYSAQVCNFAECGSMEIAPICIKSSTYPNLHQIIHIEVDIDVKLSSIAWAEATSDAPSARIAGECNLFTLLLEEIEPDGILIFRLSPDCLIMVESGEEVLERGLLYEVSVPIAQTYISES